MLVALLAAGVLVHLFVVARSDRSLTHKTALTVLNSLFGILLWLFLQPPSHPNVQDTLTVITPGATVADMQSANRARNAIVIGQYAPDELNERRVTRYLDLASVHLSHPHASTLNILGAGLGETQWNTERRWNIRFDAPALAAGLRQAHWPRRLDAGDPFTVSGRVTTTPSSVQLIDPAGDIVERSEVEIDGSFNLSGNTRSPGRFLYRLELTNSADDVTESQALPVHIVEPEPIDLLILLSAPSFESRYLKNWAGRGGARLAIRTTISDERYLSEFVARDALTLDRLDRSSLAAFDVIVADQRAWHTFDTATRNAIFAAVEQNGLGLVVMALDANLALDDGNRFPVLKPDTTRDVALLVDDAAAAANTVTLAAASFGTELARDNVIMSDISGRPVAAALALGKGRVGVTLVTDSHKLVTSGNLQQHAQYWRTLMHTMSPPVTQPGSEISPALPMVNQRVQVCVFGEPLANEAIVNDALRLALVPQLYRPNEHCGYWWPHQIGWHVLKMGAVTRHLYVFGAQDWEGIRHADATAATLLAAQRQPVVSLSDKTPLTTLPRWWFALLLLVVAGLLWLEQKLRDR